MVSEMKFVSAFNPVSLPEDPAFGNEGDLYYNSTEKNYKVKLNGVWTALINDSNLKILIAPEIFVVGSPYIAEESITIQQYHSENIINCVSASVTNITIPNQSGSNIHTGSRIGILRGGTGEVNIIAGEDVELNIPSNIYLTKTGTEIRLINVGFNQWIISGEFPDIY